MVYDCIIKEELVGILNKVMINSDYITNTLLFRKHMI